MRCPESMARISTCFPIKPCLLDDEICHALSPWFRDLPNELAAFTAHIIARNIILDGIQQLQRPMLARWTALLFPVFSFEFRLVLAHRSSLRPTVKMIMFVKTVRSEAKIYKKMGLGCTIVPT
jgi:hypothetical protein